MKRFFFTLLFVLPALCGTAAASTLQSEDLQEHIEVLSWSPRIFMYRKFLTPEECDYIIEKARPCLIPSTVVNDNAGGLISDNRRRSEGMFFPKNHGDPVLEEIEKKISLLTLIPLENGENIQVVHYEVGGEYQPHFDYFMNNTVGGVANLNRGGQRVASFLMYLNSPEEGGATIFPYVKINVQPVKGDALLFFDCRLDGTVDSLTLHGGAPVKKGEKWLATRWLRQGVFK